MKIKTIILAAGKGKRMKSNKAKVLHKIAGKPMLQRVVETAKELDSDVIVVYGHDGEQVQKTIRHLGVEGVEQAEQLGTGHAVQQTINQVAGEDIALILYADVPLIRGETLARMIGSVDSDSLSLLTVKLDDPTGYGRIVRANNAVEKIVEQKDATAKELKINEANTGIMAVKGGLLATWLAALKSDNSQNEYYLTDIIEMAVKDGVNVNTFHPRDEFEVEGVNSKTQLNTLERHCQLLLSS